MGNILPLNILEDRDIKFVCGKCGYIYGSEQIAHECIGGGGNMRKKTKGKKQLEECKLELLREMVAAQNCLETFSRDWLSDIWQPLRNQYNAVINQICELETEELEKKLKKKGE